MSQSKRFYPNYSNPYISDSNFKAKDGSSFALQVSKRLEHHYKTCQIWCENCLNFCEVASTNLKMRKPPLTNFQFSGVIAKYLTQSQVSSKQIFSEVAYQSLTVKENSWTLYLC